MLYPVSILCLLTTMAAYCSAYHGQHLAFSNYQQLPALTHNTPYHTAPAAHSHRVGKLHTASLQPVRRQFGGAGNFIRGLFNGVFNTFGRFRALLPTRFGLPFTSLTAGAGVLIPVIVLAGLLTVLFGLVANQPSGSGRGMDLDLQPGANTWNEHLKYLEEYLPSNTAWIGSDAGAEDFFLSTISGEI